MQLIIITVLEPTGIPVTVTPSIFLLPAKTALKSEVKSGKALFMHLQFPFTGMCGTVCT